MRRRRRTTITLEGWYFLAIIGVLIAGALLRQMNLLLLLAGVMFGCFVVDAIVAIRALARLDVERRLPKAVAAGDPVYVRLRASNRRRRGRMWSLLIRDHVRRLGGSRQEGRSTAGSMLQCVPPLSTEETAYAGRLPRRGRYRFGPLRITTGFPFGLVRSTLTIESVQTLVVYPRLGQLSREWQRRHQAMDRGRSHVRRKQGLVEGDFYGLRDWRRGDSQRWIHWRTSARRRTPVVRQFERQRDEDVAIVLDLWRPNHVSLVADENTELAVSLAASIVADACRRGGRSLWLAIAADGERQLSGPASPGFEREVMETLATIEASPSDGLPNVLVSLLDAVPSAANLVVISTRQADLAELPRFAAVWSDPHRRARMEWIETVNVSGPELADYFFIEPVEPPNTNGTAGKARPSDAVAKTSATQQPETF